MPALQIIEIDEQGNQFKLNEEALSAVLTQVPSGMKVSIVAVAGAFRTGKSFLLDLFLRYLRAPAPDLAAAAAGDDSWMVAEGRYLEGNVNPVKGVADGGVVRAKHDQGFAWRGGRERNTTGIWLWSEPFYRTLPKDARGNAEKVAVLLMDTQGMFDSRLTQMLTACIFGLSTLISSHQIYNVQNRIQEDNLQHLALFTEYGRITHNMHSGGEPAAEGGGGSEEPEPEPVDRGVKPPVFQKLEFLVRDWQEFEGLEGDELLAKIAGMDEYLHDVLETEGREHKDLRDVRDHIHECFEAVGTFLLPHPGFEVINPHFDGDVDKIRAPFRTLLSAYLDRTFGSGLIPKKVDGRFIDAPELLHLVKSYVWTFHEAHAFPEAKTLLAATSEANNLNAKEAAFRNYRAEMDTHCKGGYLSATALSTTHELAKVAALHKFDMIATIGARDDVERFRLELGDAMAEQYAEYVENNKHRDPFKNLEFYALPLGVGIATYFLRVTMDIICWAPATTDFDWEIRDFCKMFSDLLCDIYQLIMMVGLAVVVYKTNGAWNRIKDIFGFVRHTVASGDSASAMAAFAESQAALTQTLSAPAAMRKAGKAD